MIIKKILNKLNISKFTKLLLIIICSQNFYIQELNSNTYKFGLVNKTKDIKNLNTEKKYLGSLNWKKIDFNVKENDIKWEKIINEDKEIAKPYKIKPNKINALNRSIIYNGNRVGPDISWMFPSGFKWSEKYKFDISTRGHNTKIPDPPNKKFFAWNNGDAVGLISYQLAHWNKSSLGINIGVRSVYSGDEVLGGSTAIGEGMSAGFRWDRALSNTSGIAFGAEQLLHFDGLTDTGRNIYLTMSKGWWSSESEEGVNFPLHIATAGIGTGRMAIGTVRGLCADILGGSGTEIYAKRNLCWAPVFSLARVWDEKFSTFLEYNGRFFLLGNSLAPLQKVPLRGTFGLILSDHIDNYKFHDGKEMNWVFQLSLGF